MGVTGRNFHVNRRLATENTAQFSEIHIFCTIILVVQELIKKQQKLSVTKAVNKDKFEDDQ
jgi:hypothetical protein